RAASTCGVCRADVYLPAFTTVPWYRPQTAAYMPLSGGICRGSRGCGNANPRTGTPKPAYEHTRTRVRAHQNPRTGTPEPTGGHAGAHGRAHRNPRTSTPKPAYEHTKTRVRGWGGPGPTLGCQCTRRAST